MTTFQSLIKHLNLKSLVNSLNLAQKQSPLPFFVLKISDRTPLFPEHSSLSLSRNISDEILARFPGPLTVWSPHHLSRIIRTKGYQSASRIILKNPYKSFDLLCDSLELGVTEIVIDSRLGFHETQNFLQKNHKFANKRVAYYWQPSGHEEHIDQIAQLGSKVQGLFFTKEQGISVKNVKEMTQKVLRKGVHLKEIFCEGSESEICDLTNWQKEQLFSKGRKIDKTIDVCNYSEVDNYILATRSLCKRRTILNDEARGLIGRLENTNNIILVEQNNQQWLLSSIKDLPLDQERYLFNIETIPSLNFEQGQAVIT